MKSIPRTLLVSVLVATLGTNALADGPHGFYRQPHRDYGHRHSDAGWVAPLLFLGLAGAVIGAAASQPSPPPAPVYVVPPVTYAPPVTTYVAPAPVVVPVAPPQPPANVWYFCRSVGQYYPYTQYCPEGWQPVPPTPQP